MNILLLSLLLTLMAHLFGRYFSQKYPYIALPLWSMSCAVFLLWVVKLPFEQYMRSLQPLFSHLLGYVTVLLAVPLATIKLQDLKPLKETTALLVLATVLGAFMPMGLAYVWQLSHESVLAFATRSVTTPIGLNIALIIGSPPIVASMIIAFSGVIGAVTANLTMKNVSDRAYGLSLGLSSHAIGTVQAFYKNPEAGRYAAFGMALNGLITAIWLPPFMLAMARHVQP